MTFENITWCFQIKRVRVWVQVKASSDCLDRGGQPSFPLFVDMCKLVEGKKATSDHLVRGGRPPLIMQSEMVFTWTQFRNLCSGINTINRHYYHGDDSDTYLFASKQTPGIGCSCNGCSYHASFFDFIAFISLFTLKNEFILWVRCLQKNYTNHILFKNRLFKWVDLRRTSTKMSHHYRALFCSAFLCQDRPVMPIDKVFECFE